MTAHDTLAALGEVDSRLRELARALSNRADVSGILTRTDHSTDPPAVEWYVDAELKSGEALSWRLCAYSAGSTWTIEADVSRVITTGSYTERAFDVRATDDIGLREALLAGAADLYSTRDIQRR
jgi:hypothetical protein